MSCQGIACRIMSRHVISFRVAPRQCLVMAVAIAVVLACLLVSCLVISFHVLWCRVISCLVVSCPITSCLLFSCHVRLRHLLWCHVSSCHVMSWRDVWRHDYMHVSSCYLFFCDVMPLVLVSLLASCACQQSSRVMSPPVMPSHVRSSFLMLCMPSWCIRVRFTVCARFVKSKTGTTPGKRYGARIQTMSRDSRYRMSMFDTKKQTYL